MNGSRRLRVAKGCGRPISEVNALLTQFRDMQKMMKKVTQQPGGGGGGGRLPPGMFGGLR
jgi:signal recognition particle subunit SRP54